MGDTAGAEQAREGLEHEIDRDIYGMPAFASLQVSDPAASSRWYQQAMGFVELAVMPGPGGSTGLVHLRRYRYQDVLLVPAEGPVAPSPGVTIGLAFAGSIDDLHAQAAAARELRHGEVEGPIETPWHTVDVRFRDPDGHHLVLTARSPQPPPDAWTQHVRDSVVRPDGPRPRGHERV